MFAPRNLKQLQDGFAIFALSVTVFSIFVTAALLAFQISTMNVGDHGVSTAAISSPTRAN